MKIKTKPYKNPYFAGTILGVVLFGAYALTHSGLGASGAISRIHVALTKLLWPSHVDIISTFALMGAGDHNPLDHASVFLLIGTFAGGMISALLNGRLKFEIFKGPQISNWQRLIFALIGGLIMGYGARFARGCTSGQALSGGAVLSLGSWAFMFSVFIGGYAVAYFVRRLWVESN
ncbi:MAG TPA: YeeE/YedE thiosulfate transporter family protein [Ignavibacteria bacterium]|nr:YeeE/YedE thiosulfate transporter family protein [Ignavibacteria bacterium]HMQ99280.1 YeeE/YedE thiosulfate transporter family protein [Ignavibacteria bacterium]